MSTGDIDITDLTDVRALAAKVRSCAILLHSGTALRIGIHHIVDELNEVAGALDAIARKGDQ